MLPDYFIASGHDISGSILRLYRYHDIMVPHCAKADHVECEETPIDWNPQNIEAPCETTTIEMLPLASFPMETPVDSICD